MFTKAMSASMSAKAAKAADCKRSKKDRKPVSPDFTKILSAQTRLANAFGVLMPL